MSFSILKTGFGRDPAYNASNTIQQAIATARGQTLRPTQIVVVDDCSKDDTIAKGRSRRRPRPAGRAQPEERRWRRCTQSRHRSFDRRCGRLPRRRRFVGAEQARESNGAVAHAEARLVLFQRRRAGQRVRREACPAQARAVPRRKPRGLHAQVRQHHADQHARGAATSAGELSLQRKAATLSGPRLRAHLGRSRCHRGVLPRTAGRVAQRRQSEARQLESRSGDHADVSERASPSHRAHRSSDWRFAASGRRQARRVRCAGRGAWLCLYSQAHCLRRMR